MKNVLRVFVVLTLIFTTFGTAHAVIPPIERGALIALYDSTNGDQWDDNTNWGGEIGSECEWYGITCDSTGTTVTVIDIGNRNLNGTIPIELGNLSNLEVLSLGWNQLSGEIPPQLGTLSNLEKLRLQFNQLSGAIYTIGVGKSFQP